MYLYLASIINNIIGAFEKCWKIRYIIIVCVFFKASINAIERLMSRTRN